MHRVVFEPEHGQRVPVFIWARSVSPEALRQLKSIASQAWAVDHVAAMPDVHLSEGVGVGTVFATEHTVIPAALGGDLGCGMAAVRFDLAAASLGRRDLERILQALARVIPVGDAIHPGSGITLPDAVREGALSTRALARKRDWLGPRHLGTLGGGNHFLEIDRDAAGGLWLMLHTGSRGLGAAIAVHHRRAADALMGNAPLAALDARTPGGAAYLDDVGWALSFARANRDEILARACTVLADLTGAIPDLDGRLDVHHNFVAREMHGGRELMIHRKGATSARAGELGLVPGSMGTASYIVRGRGGADSFCSCSHGAGRVLTRREAREKVSARSLEQAMRSIVFDRARSTHLVEEAPAAYRDIREVLEDQSDLVEPVVRLEPIAVLKG